MSTSTEAKRAQMFNKVLAELKLAPDSTDAHVLDAIGDLLQRERDKLKHAYDALDAARVVCSSVAEGIELLATGPNDLTAEVDAALTKHFEGVEPLGRVQLSPAVVEDFDRFRQVTAARDLLMVNGWIDDVPCEWWHGVGAVCEMSSVIVNRKECSPENLRALAILAEEART